MGSLQCEFLHGYTDVSAVTLGPNVVPKKVLEERQTTEGQRIYVLYDRSLSSDTVVNHNA